MAPPEAADEGRCTGARQLHAFHGELGYAARPRLGVRARDDADIGTVADRARTAPGGSVPTQTTMAAPRINRAIRRAPRPVDGDAAMRAADGSGETTTTS